MRSRTVRRALALTALAVLAPAGSALAQAAPNPLRPGALYAATNEATGNRIVTFTRAHDGTLTPSGSFATGGTGSGGFEGSANGVVLANHGREVAPINLEGSSQFLLATNTGSGSVSVFLTRPDGLVLADVESAGLNHPISVTVSRGIVYVLNGGASNCLGGAPTITGFTLSQQGELTPIPGSTRPVSGGPSSGCSQVSFNPKGDVLVVTEKQADIVSTYLVDGDGVASAPIANPTSGIGPFGFTFTQTGKLLETENFGGAPGQGSAASYEIGDDGDGSHGRCRRLLMER